MTRPSNLERICFAIVSMVICCGSTTAAGAGELDRSARKAAIETLAGSLREHYVFDTEAEKLASDVEAASNQKPTTPSLPPSCSRDS